MKKLLLIAMLLMLGIGTFAQSTPATITVTATDSVLATTTIYRGFTLTQGSGISNMSLQVIVTKIGATAIGGNLTLQGSNDGTNYFNVNTAYVRASDTTTQVATLTDVATQSFTFTQVNLLYRYYRIKCTGTGSGSWRPAVYGRIYY